jgi:hypothetical protein
VLHFLQVVEVKKFLFSIHVLLQSVVLHVKRDVVVLHQVVLRRSAPGVRESTVGLIVRNYLVTQLMQIMQHFVVVFQLGLNQITHVVVVIAQMVHQHVVHVRHQLVALVIEMLVQTHQKTHVVQELQHQL